MFYKFQGKNSHVQEEAKLFSQTWDVDQAITCHDWQWFCVKIESYKDTRVL
jgi:hypothetical protein